MTTERDDYQLDTYMAVTSLRTLVEGLKDVKTATGDAKAAQESWATFLKEDLDRAFFSAQARWDLFKEAVRAGAEFMKESVADYLSAERAINRLGVALKNAGQPQGVYLDNLDRQASALERLTGVDGDYIIQLQTLITSMGVGANQLQDFTKAALDLAAATGQDAMKAAQLLARANAEGKDELKRYAIEVDDAAFKTRGFAAVLDEVKAKYGGLSEAQPELLATTNRVTGAWKDFKEAVGEATLEVLAFKAAGVGLETILDGWTEVLTRKSQKSVDAYVEATAKATELTDQYHAQLEEGKKRQKEYADAVHNNAFNVDYFAKRLAESKEIIRQTALEQNKLGVNVKLDVDPLTKKITLPTQEIDLNDAKERIRQQKAAAEAYKRYREEMEKIAVNSAANLKKMDDEEDRKRLESIQKTGDWETAQLEERKRELAEYYEAEHKLATEAEEKRQQLADQKAAAEKQFWEGMKQQLQSYAETMVNTMTGFLKDSLLENTRYNRELEALRIERETAGMSEEDAAKRRSEIQKELAQDNASAALKITADTLAGIAQQAATKAIMEGAEAVAAAARYDYAAAGQHGVAAALYAGVAVAAGGTAAIISSSRGMTKDERESLAAERENAKERKDREQKQAAQAAQVAGTQVNVYNLGITGQTELEQAKELERIRQQYQSLATGGG